MMQQLRSSLATYLTNLQSEGRIAFTRDEAIAALEVTEGGFLKAAARLQKRRMLFNPRHGFYVAVPPQFLSWEAPPPPWYIDELMRHEGRPYYVGLLKAAELHGATHQAVMEFQVITDKRLPKIRAGRSAIAFYYRKDMGAVSEGIEDHKTDTGRMKVSSVELTLLDLLRYPHAAGGLDTIATIVSDLGDRIDPAKLVTLSATHERSVAQRLGYLLDRFGHRAPAEALRAALPHDSALGWVELEPSQAADPVFAPEPVERVERWHVIVRRP